jgi:hypothetical protein
MNLDGDSLIQRKRDPIRPRRYLLRRRLLPFVGEHLKKLVHNVQSGSNRLSVFRRIEQF